MKTKLLVTSALAAGMGLMSLNGAAVFAQGKSIFVPGQQEGSARDFAPGRVKGAGESANSYAVGHQTIVSSPDVSASPGGDSTDASMSAGGDVTDASSTTDGDSADTSTSAGGDGSDATSSTDGESAGASASTDGGSADTSGGSTETAATGG